MNDKADGKKREGYLAEGISDMQPHHMHIHLHLVVQGRRDYRPDKGENCPLTCDYQGINPCTTGGGTPDKQRPLGIDYI